MMTDGGYNIMYIRTPTPTKPKYLTEHYLLLRFSCPAGFTSFASIRWRILAILPCGTDGPCELAKSAKSFVMRSSKPAPNDRCRERRVPCHFWPCLREHIYQQCGKNRLRRRGSDGKASVQSLV